MTSSSSSSSAAAASIHPASPPPFSLPSQWIIRLENPRPLPTTQPSPVHLLVPRSPRILPWCPSPPHLPPLLLPSPPPGKAPSLSPALGLSPPWFVCRPAWGPSRLAGWLAAVAQLDRHAASAAPPPANAPSSQGGVRPISDLNPYSLLAGV